MAGHGARRLQRAAAFVLGAAALVIVLTAGCGGAPSPADSSAGDRSTLGTQEPASSTERTVPGSDTSTTMAGQPGAVGAVFAQLATTSSPMAIFAPTYLPDGTVLAPEWLPVVESEDPTAYDGPPVSNPRVLGSGANSDIQVTFQSGGGWLAVLEGFRGDLGDVEGTPVGLADGHAGTLYQVNGGDLVQWSKDGLWYGVFGRDMSRDDVVDVAHGMRQVSQ
jgi:hypothetical protein